LKNFGRNYVQFLAEGDPKRKARSAKIYKIYEISARRARRQRARRQESPQGKELQDRELKNVKRGSISGFFLVFGKKFVSLQNTIDHADRAQYTIA